MIRTSLLTDFERDCALKTLPPLGAFITEHIGIDKSFADMSKQHVTEMVSIIISAYQTEISKGSTEVPF